MRDAVVTGRTSATIPTCASCSGVAGVTSATENFERKDGDPGEQGISCTYTRRHKPEQIPVYEELAGRHGLSMTVGSDYHGFNGADYEAPQKMIDIRYLEKLGSRVEWPAVEKAG